MALHLVTPDQQQEPVIVEPKMITPAEVTGLVTLMTGLLKDTEERIVERFIEKLTENAVGAAERWKAHEEAHQREHAEFLRLRDAVETHHHAAYESQIRTKARLTPILRVAEAVRLYWPQIVLAAALMVALLGWFDATHKITATP